MCMQYTIRGIPTAVDRALRERARSSGKSLNETAIDVLTDGLGLTNAPRKRRDLSFIVGTYVPDKGFEEAIADQDRIDEEMWR